MKLTTRQKNEIQNIVREEAERTIAGRRFHGSRLSEVRPAMSRIGPNIVMDALGPRISAWAAGKATSLLSGLDERLWGLIKQELNKSGAGGRDVVFDDTTVDEIISYDEGKFLELESELEDDIRQALERYGLAIADLAAYSLEEDDDDY